MTLPPLPKAARLTIKTHGAGEIEVMGYTGQQMREYGESCARAALSTPEGVDANSSVGDLTERSGEVPAMAATPSPSVVAWLHGGQGRYDVIHDKARQLWIDSGMPKHVEHYTIPLKRADQ